MHNSTIRGRIAMLFSAVGLTISSFTNLHAQYYESYSTIKTYAGKGGNPATPNNTPYVVAVDSDGNYYYGSPYLLQVFKVDKVTHTATAFAGSINGNAGDGGLAENALLKSSAGLAFDSRGNLYISDYLDCRIRRIDKVTGIITTVAGNGSNGRSGDGGLATRARIRNWGIAFDKDDNLFIADYLARVIRRVDANTGIISTVIGAGGDGLPGDGGLALDAHFGTLKNFCIDSQNNFYIVDNDNLRKVTASTQRISHLSGGTVRFTEGRQAMDTRLFGLYSVVVDPAGDLLLSVRDMYSILKYHTATQTLTRYAGSLENGFWGNNVPSTAARLAEPEAMAITKEGDLVFTQQNYQVLRKVSITSGNISDVYVPKGSAAGDIGDGGDANDAQFNIPRDVAVDPDGNVYIADGVNQRIRKINKLTNIISTIAGTGEIGNGGIGGLATEARFNDPAGMAFDNQGNLLIADRLNNQIKKVDKITNIITLVAGAPGTQYGSGMGGPAVDAVIYKPTDMVVDANGNIYISTSGDRKFGNVIYKVSTDGKINYFAGIPINGIQSNGAYYGDGGPATAAALRDPHGLAIDATGNLIFCDKGNNVIRKINLQNNIITTIAGNGYPGRAGDGGPALNAELDGPDDLAITPSGNVVIADLGNNQMRLLDIQTNKLYTVAGTGTIGFSGDGGQAILAELNQVDGMAVDANGLTYIADQFNNRIRTFTMPSIITGLLPVTLINFSVTAMGQNALVQWSTASEHRAAYFVIERSTNGKDNWQTAGTVTATGNSSLLKDYSFTDKNAMSGNNYYRLRQVDVDLKAVYSATVMVNFKNTANLEFAVYPNPVLDYATITLNSNLNSKGIIKIIDAAGAVHVQKTVDVIPGNNTFRISNLAPLSCGMYMLQVNIEGSNMPIIKKVLKM